MADCASTEVANSDHSETDPIAGKAGDEFQINCNPGFSGSGLVTCSDGSFSPVITCVELPQCAATQVSNSDHSANGSISGWTGKVVEVICIDGFVGSDATTCGEDGLFSPTINCHEDPRCIPTQVAYSDYSAPGSIAGAAGTTISVVCDDGYIGGGETTCNGGDIFAFTFVACSPALCEPTNVSNSDHEDPNSIAGRTGDEVEVECDNGYSLSGGGGAIGTATCGTDGTFNELLCVEKTVAPTVQGTPAPSLAPTEAPKYLEVLDISFDVVNTFPDSVSQTQICDVTTDALCDFLDAEVSLPLQRCKGSTCEVSPFAGDGADGRLLNHGSHPVVASVSVIAYFGSYTSAPRIFAANIFAAIEEDASAFNALYVAAAKRHLPTLEIGAPSRISEGGIELYESQTTLDMIRSSDVLKACVAAFLLALALCLVSVACYCGYCRCCCCELEEGRNPERERMSEAAQKRAERDRRSEDRKAARGEFMMVAAKGGSMV